MTYKGSCLCKTVKFEVVGEFEDFYLCHCKYCRKDSGSAHAANLFSKSAKLKWLQGEAYVRTFQLKDTNHVKGFCSNCGSALPNLQMNGSLLVVPAGSLDSQLDKQPDGHIFISDKANWDEELETYKKFDRFPTE
ncbi:MAG: aldehyde-activating protein [Clostridiales bacterium 38-18]|nr:MAG: aldehyde-activating protein [Clostridiales bacterium 38-18]